MRHKTLFISDLHLQYDAPHLYSLFANFMQQNNETVDAIYILGDLFEFWIGDDDQSPFHGHVMKLLRTTCNAAIPIYIQRGNRDFLLGEQFCKATGCTLLPDEVCINLYNTPILLMHGDLLCRDDIAYQRMRKVFHNRFIRNCFLRLPLTWRRLIAEKIRSRSEKHGAQYGTDARMDVTPKAVVETLQKHKAQYLIHGHTHKPAIHRAQAHTRIVLGAWHEKASVLTWYEDGEMQLSY